MFALDYDVLLLLSVAVVLILGILVLGGLVLSARSYAALLELVRYLSKLAESSGLLRITPEETTVTEEGRFTRSSKAGKRPVPPTDAD